MHGGCRSVALDASRGSPPVPALGRTALGISFVPGGRPLDGRDAVLHAVGCVNLSIWRQDWALRAFITNYDPTARPFKWT